VRRRAVLRILLLLLILTAPILMWLLRGRDPGEPGPLTEPYPVGTVHQERRGPAVQRVDSRAGVMGTLFVVEVAAPDDTTALSACRAAWVKIRALEETLSTWIPDSLLSHVNREAGRAPVVVDAETFDLLVLSGQHHELTGGTFDPTVGPLLRVWRPLAKLRKMPTSEEVAAAQALVGFGQVSLNPAGRTVSFAQEGVSLNLGGIAKGYAADLAAECALEAGASACRVNAGGDLVARGAPPWSPGGFTVEIRDPLGSPADTLSGRTFTLLDRGVATSGNYERFTMVGDQRFSHILDPRTGRPVTDSVLQVTVIAPTGTEADALATALTVLGPDAGLRLAEKLPDVEAVFFAKSGAGLESRATSGFPGETR
jgi:thiamine biosynthesis lipoprotein